jgi:hypothetical protein
VTRRFEIGSEGSKVISAVIGAGQPNPEVFGPEETEDLGPIVPKTRVAKEEPCY